MSKTKAKSSSVVKPVARASSPPAATPSEAQRLAATILEVLGGMRSPPEAAQTLSISLPRYYQLEARALEGLLAALAPRPLGKQPSLENRVKQLEKQLETAHRAMRASGSPGAGHPAGAGALRRSAPEGCDCSRRPPGTEEASARRSRSQSRPYAACAGVGYAARRRWLAIRPRQQYNRWRRWPARRCDHDRPVVD